MRRPVIHQVLLGAAEGDAITQMALSLRSELEKFADSEIYALLQHGDLMKDSTLPLREIPNSEVVDVLLYHSSIGWQEMTDFLLSRTEKLAVSYHNITPAHFYETYQPEFARDLRIGRTELELIRKKVVLTVADSSFNAEDIKKHGYHEVVVIPAGFSPKRLCKEQYDIRLLNELSVRFPNGYVIAVGQVLPHKRVEEVIETMHIMNSTYWGNVGLVICGVARQPNYREAINKFQKRCAMVDIHFTGAVSNSQLATLLRGARAYLGMSDHEGLCIPPVEAMSLGVPVVIKGAGAVPETMGGGALVLPEDCGPILASEAVYEVLNNDEMRWELINSGYKRAEELESRTSSTRMAELLRDAV
jgi:glycosyltransferase involved in cell wall biosynthesis